MAPSLRRQWKVRQRVAPADADGDRLIRLADVAHLQICVRKALVEGPCRVYDLNFVADLDLGDTPRLRAFTSNYPLPWGRRRRSLVSTERFDLDQTIGVRYFQFPWAAQSHHTS